MIQDYPKIDFYSLAKSQWDSIFDMIPWLERIEKIDPKEMYTDHNGTRTRPVKYVEYKSASVQLIGRLFTLLKRFDWTYWHEGIDILKKQDFTGLNLPTIGKLLTIILYYQESLKDISPFGIPCQAHVLEDGRILKLLKELKIVISQELKRECEKHHVYFPNDSKFESYGKLLQSRWREKKGYPIGSQNSSVSFGHFIEANFAIVLAP